MQRFFDGKTENATEENLAELQRTMRRPDAFPKGKFGEVEVQNLVSEYSASPRLLELSGELVRSYGTLKSLFLRPIANSGNWAKLKWSGQFLFSSSSVQRLLDQVGEPLTTTSLSPDRIFKLYVALFESCQIPAEPRNRLLAALAHVLALDDPDLQNDLKSRKGKLLIFAVGNALQARRKTFSELIGDRFDANAMVASSSSVTKVALFDEARLHARFQSAREETERNAAREVLYSYRVRPLSAVESPFRSCLADDCATSTYFARALDPDYYYFTVTTPNNHSRGHVTVVLGTAKDSSGRQRSVGFVDKVQGIDRVILDTIMEAIRLSLAHGGYELAVPVKVGDENGISNHRATSQAILGLSTVSSQTQRYEKFHSDQSTPSVGDNGFSRADQKLRVIPLLPLHTPATVRMQLRPPVPARLVSTHADLWTMIAATFSLKDGLPDQRIAYLDVMEQLAEAGMPTEPGFEQIAESMAQNRGQPLAVRNRAMRALLTIAPERIPSAWPSFTRGEITTLLQNWNQAPDLRSKLTWVIWTALPFADRDVRYLQVHFRSALSDEAFTSAAEAARLPIVLQHSRALVRADAGLAQREYESSLIEAFVAFAGAHNARQSNRPKAVVKELEKAGIDAFLHAIDSSANEAEASRSPQHFMAIAVFARLLVSSGLKIEADDIIAVVRKEIDRVRPSLAWLKFRRTIGSPISLLTPSGALFGLVVYGLEVGPVDRFTVTASVLGSFFGPILTYSSRPSVSAIMDREARLAMLRSITQLLPEAAEAFKAQQGSSAEPTKQGLLCPAAIGGP